MTYPRATRAKSLLSSSQRIRGSNCRSALLYPVHDYSDNGESLIELTDMEEDVAAFDRRSEELLSGAHSKRGATEECTKCKQFLDFASKVQNESRESKQSLEIMQAEIEAERTTWTREKEEMKRKMKPLAGPFIITH